MVKASSTVEVEKYVLHIMLRFFSNSCFKINNISIRSSELVSISIFKSSTKLPEYRFFQENPVKIRQEVELLYKIFGGKGSKDAVMKAGTICVSVVFRPVASVAQSGIRILITCYIERYIF